MSRWIGGVVLAASVGAGALVAIPAGAQETAAAAPPADTPSEVSPPADLDTCQALFDTLPALDPLPPELVAELNSEADRLGEALSAAGVAFEMVTDADGVRWPEFDEGDEAAWKVVDDFFAELDGADLGVGDPLDDPGSPVTAEELDACEQLWAGDLSSDWEPTAQEIDQMKSDAAEFRAMLDEAGVDYTLVTDDLGIAWPEFDDTDPAAMAKLTELMVTSVLTEDLTPEDVAWINEDAKGLAAAFDEAGVSYQWQEGDNGVRIPVWDFSDESAMEVLDTFMTEEAAEGPATDIGNPVPTDPGDGVVSEAVPNG